MKIHVAASRSSVGKKGIELELIKSDLEKRGHFVRIDHILHPKRMDHLAERDLQHEYKRVQDWIKSADFLIAEITTPSNGVGHEIFLALNEKKPVLALYAYGLAEQRDVTVRGNPSKYLTTKSYTKESLSKILKEYCEEVQDKLDSKFILTLNPELDKFLTWLAEDERTSKAQIVRGALSNKRNKDKRYKEYLKKLEH